MTPSADPLAPLCPCPSGGSSDLVPLLVVLALLIGLRLALAWLKKKGWKPVKNVKGHVIVVVLVLAVGVVLAVKQRQAGPGARPAESATPAAASEQAPAAKALPRLVDLGAGKCIPCKMMAPILEEMKKTYEGQLQVDFIDVWENPNAGREYGIRVIPTQVFFSPDGKELARHEGFMSREDLLGQWAKLGVTFTDSGAE